MAQISYSRNAISSLERLHRFLAERNPDAAARAINTIVDRLAALEDFPRLGPVDPDRPGFPPAFHTIRCGRLCRPVSNVSGKHRGRARRPPRARGRLLARTALRA